jgi:hypothetical protein
MFRFDVPGYARLAGFNAGFMLACAALLYPLAAILVILLVPAYYYGQSEGGRSVALIVLGLVAPLLFCITGWFAAGALSEFITGQFTNTIYLWRDWPSGGDWLVIGVSLAMTILGAGASMFTLKQRPLQERKYFALTFWWLLMAWLCQGLDAHSFPVLLLGAAFPISIFAGELFHRRAGTLWVELVHLALIACVGWSTYLVFRNGFHGL